MGSSHIMSKLRRHFIDDNRETLQLYYGKADSKIRPVYGFGANSPKESFEAILTKADDFYLPVCFLHIFWDYTNPESREFVLQSLESLYQIDDEGRVTDPKIAYVYAYCLLQTDKDDESFDILKILSDECFPPALVTMGDGAVANQEITNALNWYQHAIDHGYLPIIGRRNKLIFKDSSFLRSLPRRLMMTLHAFVNYLKFVKVGMKGENVLYLDFYSIGYHLKNYWKTPRAKRIEKLNAESALFQESTKIDV